MGRPFCGQKARIRQTAPDSKPKNYFLAAALRFGAAFLFLAAGFFFAAAFFFGAAFFFAAAFFLAAGFFFAAAFFFAAGLRFAAAFTTFFFATAFFFAAGLRLGAAFAADFLVTLFFIVTVSSSLWLSLLMKSFASSNYLRSKKAPEQVANCWFENSPRQRWITLYYSFVLPLTTTTCGSLRKKNTMCIKKNFIWKKFFWRNTHLSRCVSCPSRSVSGTLGCAIGEWRNRAAHPFR